MRRPSMECAVRGVYEGWALPGVQGVISDIQTFIEDIYP